MKNLKEFKPLWNLIKEEKGKIILATTLIFINGITDIFTGYLNGGAVEAITNLNVKLALLYLGIYFLLKIVFDTYASATASAMFEHVENILTRKLGFGTYKKALYLPAYAYEKTSSGEIINRITNDADALSFTIGRLISMISYLIGSILILIYVFINSWIIGLEIILFMVILGLILKKYNPLLKEAHKKRKEDQDKFTSIVSESVRGIREIKTLGIKDNLISNVKLIINSIIKKTNNEIDISKKFNILTRTLKDILEVGVFVTCVILLYYRKIDLTFFVAMTYYVYRYMWLIENINDFSKTYQKILVSITRVNEIMDNRLYDDESFGTEKVKKVKGVIEFKNVNFAYPDEELLLKDFNLKLEPNKKIAIVGRSGQGKSTLFNLLTRVFDPINGCITLDNVNIKDLSEDELRTHISIIRQEPFIFNRSIMDNFKIVNENIKLEEIRKFAKVAYIDEYIMSLPKKYDTILGEGGVNLSGGQKQRLSIARTLAKKSKVILLDEATSALDNNSQDYIKKTIDNLIKDHTVVIVAHRLSTIIDADIIYVVENGQIKASGTHKELLKKSKTYKNLYETESLNS